MMKLFVELSIKYDEDTIYPEAVQGLVIDKEEKALVDIAIAPTIAGVFKIIEKTWVLNFVRIPDGSFDGGGELTLLQVAEKHFPDLDRKVKEKELPPLIEGIKEPEVDTDDRRTRTQKIV